MWKVNENKLLSCKLDGMEHLTSSIFYARLFKKTNWNVATYYGNSLFYWSVKRNLLFIIFPSVLTVIHFDRLGRKECFWLNIIYCSTLTVKHLSIINNELWIINSSVEQFPKLVDINKAMYWELFGAVWRSDNNKKIHSKITKSGSQ